MKFFANSGHSERMSTKLRFRRAIPEDATRLGPRLRIADLREIQAVFAEDPIEVLLRGITISDPCFALTDDSDYPLAIFGVVPDLRDPETGVAWLLGSNAITELRFFSGRNSRRWLERLHEKYRTLWNVAEASNASHLRWLEWCGFRRVRTVERNGLAHGLFYELESVREKS
jgi:hypothetical protein